MIIMICITYNLGYNDLWWWTQNNFNTFKSSVPYLWEKTKRRGIYINWWGVVLWLWIYIYIYNDYEVYIQYIQLSNEVLQKYYPRAAGPRVITSPRYIKCLLFLLSLYWLGMYCSTTTCTYFCTLVTNGNYGCSLPTHGCGWVGVWAIWITFSHLNVMWYDIVIMM